MFIPYSIVNPLIVVRVARRLPRAGEVLVQIGDTVEPAHIVAEATQPPDFRIVDIARELDLPVKRVKKYLKVNRGDNVSKGDVLASTGGLRGGICRAPIDGTIVGSGRGRLLLEAESQKIQLSALIPGTVVERWAGLGVLIESVGAFIEGAWGNGQESYGVLRVVVRAARYPIRPKHIDASAQGAILVGGSRLDEETLDHAIEMQVRGIIVGGIPPALIPRLQALDFPVVSTEGIGATPMSKATFDLLRSLDGRETAVSGRLRPRWGSQRPYIVIPMPTQIGEMVDPETHLDVGSRVRILRAPHAGVSGTVVDIPTGYVQLETGARLPGIRVDFGGNEEALVPQRNLERLL